MKKLIAVLLLLASDLFGQTNIIAAAELDPAVESHINSEFGEVAGLQLKMALFMLSNSIGKGGVVGSVDGQNQRIDVVEEALLNKVSFVTAKSGGQQVDLVFDKEHPTIEISKDLALRSGEVATAIAHKFAEYNIRLRATEERTPLAVIQEQVSASQLAYMIATRIRAFVEANTEWLTASQLTALREQLTESQNREQKSRNYYQLMVGVLQLDIVSYWMGQHPDVLILLSDQPNAQDKIKSIRAMTQRYLSTISNYNASQAEFNVAEIDDGYATLQKYANNLLVGDFRPHAIEILTKAPIWRTQLRQLYPSFDQPKPAAAKI